MTTSVALCTYNGERYIRKQMESILNQTMKVDEIVICDDGSSDSTVKIIHILQATATHTNILLYQNKTPLGVANNFQKAVNLCQGDIIFLSDQDDIWHPDKVETIVGWFNDNLTISVVITDAILIDSIGEKLKNPRNTLFKNTYTQIEQKLFNSGRQLESFLFENHATGATMAIRKTFLEKHPFAYNCSDEILHDYVIALQAVQEHELGIIDRPLISYRIHSQQTCGLVPQKITPTYQWQRIYVIDTAISPLLQSDEAKESAKFIIYRTRQTCRPLGCFGMIGHVADYYHYYRKTTFLILCKDLSIWLSILLHRNKKNE